MDDTKYQVFVSSTYTDLKDERKRIFYNLLKAGCIPAGMESFVASNEEQFEVIKKVIDSSDYYILILGKRYGSINKKTGKSYTEMEYDYAESKNIPILVFPIDDSVKLPPQKVEQNEDNKRLLADFRQKVTANRVVDFWHSREDLLTNINNAINDAIKNNKRLGWHKGSNSADEELLKELKQLRSKNEKLQTQLQNEKKTNENLPQGFHILPEPSFQSGLCFVSDDNENNKTQLDRYFYGKKIILHYINNLGIPCETQTTIDKLFKFISLHLQGTNYMSKLYDALSAFYNNYTINAHDVLIIRNKLEQLNIISTSVDFDGEEIIELTALGTNIMNKMNLD